MPTLVTMDTYLIGGSSKHMSNISLAFLTDYSEAG